jgi:hypothetical protein
MDKQGPKLSEAEQSLRNIEILNLARRLSHRVEQYDECDDRRSPEAASRFRELMDAAAELVDAYTHRRSDGLLSRLYGDSGPKPGSRRASSGQVTPLKRGGGLLD